MDGPRDGAAGRQRPMKPISTPAAMRAATYVVVGLALFGTAFMLTWFADVLHWATAP